MTSSPVYPEQFRHDETVQVQRIFADLLVIPFWHQMQGDVERAIVYRLFHCDCERDRPARLGSKKKLERARLNSYSAENRPLDF